MVQQVEDYRLIWGNGIRVPEGSEEDMGGCGGGRVGCVVCSIWVSQGYHGISLVLVVWLPFEGGICKLTECTGC